MVVVPLRCLEQSQSSLTAVPTQRDILRISECQSRENQVSQAELLQVDKEPHKTNKNKRTATLIDKPQQHITKPNPVGRLATKI